MSLQLVSQDNTETIIDVDVTPFVLGSGADCNYRLQVTGISARHACIVRNANRYFIWDLHSKNGTHVILSPVYGEARSIKAPPIRDSGDIQNQTRSLAPELKDGTVVVFGNAVFTCRVMTDVANQPISLPDSGGRNRAVILMKGVLIAVVLLGLVVVTGVLWARSVKPTVVGGEPSVTPPTNMVPLTTCVSVTNPVPRESVPMIETPKAVAEEDLSKGLDSSQKAVQIASDNQAAAAMAGRIEGLLELEKIVGSKDVNGIDYREVGRIATRVQAAIIGESQGEMVFKAQVWRVLGPLKTAVIAEAQKARDRGDYLGSLKRIREGLEMLPGDKEFQDALIQLEPVAKPFLDNLITQAYWMENDRSPEKRSQADAIYRDISAATSANDWTRRFHETATERMKKVQ